MPEIKFGEAARQVILNMWQERVGELNARSQSIRDYARTRFGSEDSFIVDVPYYIDEVRSIRDRRLALERAADALLYQNRLRIENRDGASELLSILYQVRDQASSPQLFGMHLEGNYPNLHKRMMNKIPNVDAEIEALQRIR